jgi:hypothetical protein
VRINDVLLFDVSRMHCNMVDAVGWLLLHTVNMSCSCCAADPSNATPRLPRAGDHRVQLSVVEVDGVHRSVMFSPQLKPLYSQHSFTSH